MFNQCSTSGQISKSQIKILNRTIEEILKEENNPLKQGFIVNPYLNYFEFNSYFKRKRGNENYNSEFKNESLKSLGLSDNDFEKLQMSTDAKFLDNYNH